MMRHYIKLEVPDGFSSMGNVCGQAFSDKSAIPFNSTPWHLL
jgi:hypothetical protein